MDRASCVGSGKGTMPASSGRKTCDSPCDLDAREVTEAKDIVLDIRDGLGMCEWGRGSSVRMLVVRMQEAVGFEIGMCLYLKTGFICLVQSLRSGLTYCFDLRRHY